MTQKNQRVPIKTISLELAHSLLESADHILIDGNPCTHLHGPLTGEAENEFLQLKWVTPETSRDNKESDDHNCRGGIKVTTTFLEGENRFPRIHEKILFLRDHGGYNTQIQLLVTQDLEAIVDSCNTARTKCP
jgi:hypothetical protein